VRLETFSMHNKMLILIMMLSSQAFAQGERYLFVTFKGEQTPMTEQVYFAVSENGRDWKALNRGEPVLKSEIGEKGVRDPFLIRSHDGKRYHLLGTDLSINLNPDWGRASTRGSRAILIWESEDLVRWSKPRRVEVAPPDAGCAWAPEAVYDAEAEEYLVFWASRTQSDDFAKFRIWASRTKDFVSFSKPFIYIEKPFPVIDTTIVNTGGTYYRFTKNEHDKSVFLEVSQKLHGQWQPLDAFNLAKLRGVEGPAVFPLRDKAGLAAQWCLILDHYGRGEGYKAYVTEDLAQAQFQPMANMSSPFRLRHGSVLGISEAQHASLLKAFAPSEE
jgi:sucrose-6-phosphate hydrolase SacC (GH32 family)